jgi:hypothetical protein
LDLLRALKCFSNPRESFSTRKVEGLAVLPDDVLPVSLREQDSDLGSPAIRKDDHPHKMLEEIRPVIVGRDEAEYLGR